MKRVWVLGALMGVLFAGCGGSGDGTIGVDSGLPAEQRLTDLDPDQVKQLCEAAEIGLTDFVRDLYSMKTLCSGLGTRVALRESTEAGFHDLCIDLRDSCLKNPPEEFNEVQTPADLDCAVGTYFGCNATVEQYEGCFETIFVKVREAVEATASCNATREEVATALQDPDRLDEDLILGQDPACQALEACSELSIAAVFQAIPMR